MAPPLAAAHSIPPVDDLEDRDDSPADADRDEAWEAEIDRRIAEQRAGRGRAFTLEEVQAHARAKFGW